MKKVLKTPCKLTLEEEYAFEHRQRMKAESYIQEIWEMNQELTKEILRLEKVIGDSQYAKHTVSPSTDEIRLKMKLDKIYKERNEAIKRMEAKLWEKKKS